MRARFKKIALAGIIVLALIQFIQPARNQSGQVLETDVSRIITVPDPVQTSLKKACYDCHSNNTDYPWYTYVQPIGWLMSNHIRNGKEKLNFSDFGAYSKRRQASKLKSIASQVENDEMPISSYTWMHKNALLSQTEKDLIITWANSTRDSLTNIN
jgi:hypothetical protein